MSLSPRTRLHLERLDDRTVPAVIANATINADPGTGGIGLIDDAVRGVNVSVGDSPTQLTDPLIIQRAKDAGLKLYRVPGGTYSDVIHFDKQNPNEGALYQRFKSNWLDLMKFAEAAGGRKLVTLNYGTGSPQESAAWVAYMNGTNAADATAIGWGQSWTIKPGRENLSTDAADWDVVWKDWKTVGFWAGLRQATPLPQDDGLNWLRIGRAKSFDTEYVEVGNEVYGDWEPNMRSRNVNPPAGRYPAADYVWYAKTFTGLIRNMQLSVQPKVGVTLSGGPDYGNWDALVMQQCGTQYQNFGPDFIVDHPYASLYNASGDYSRTDYNLLHNTSTDPAPGNRNNWLNRANTYRTLAAQQGVPNAAAIQVMATEFGNTGSFPITNQGTNLPNALWLADTYGQALNAGYAGLTYFPFMSEYDSPGNLTAPTLYNGWQEGNSWKYSAGYDPQFYGWRKGASWGMIGNGMVNVNNGPQQYATAVDTTQPGAANFRPQSGRGVPFPTYFAQQLYAQLAHTGDTTVTAVDDNPDLSVYAVRQGADSHLRLLVVNKSATNDKYVYFNLKNFQLNAAAGVKAWRYDMGNDNSQRDSTDGMGWGVSAWSQAPDSFTLNGPDSTMPFWFSAYSMTVLDLGSTNSNFVVNPGFEAGYDKLTTNQYIGQPAGWTQVGNGYAQSGYNVTPKTGGVYGLHWNSVAYTADSSQSLTSLPNGSYTLTAWVKSSGGQTAANLYVSGYGGAQRTASLNPATAGGWGGAWKLVQIPDVQVTNGTAKIGFNSNAAAGQWVLFDDVVFARNLTTNSNLSGGTAGWGVWSGPTGTGAGAFTAPATGGRSGGYGLISKTTAYEGSVNQTRTGLPNGVYNLTAWVQASGGTGATQMMYVQSYGGAWTGVNVPATNTWTLITIPNIKVTNNQIEYGFYSKAGANQWIKFDDVQFFDPPLTGDTIATPPATPGPVARLDPDPLPLSLDGSLFRRKDQRWADWAAGFEPIAVGW